MWPLRQHRFARTTATGDDHAAEVGIHSHQKESQLGGVMACDGSQGQDSSPEEDKSGQEDGRAEDLGAVIVADCNGPPVLQLGKDVLDFVTHLVQLPCCHGPASCGGGVGCKVRCLVLPASHGFCPCHTLCPPSLGQCGKSFSTTSAPAKSLHCPSLRRSRRGSPVADPMELAAVSPPWHNQSGGVPPPFEAGCRGMSFKSGGVNQ